MHTKANKDGTDKREVRSLLYQKQLESLAKVCKPQKWISHQQILRNKHTKAKKSNRLQINFYDSIFFTSWTSSPKNQTMC